MLRQRNFNRLIIATVATFLALGETACSSSHHATPKNTVVQRTLPGLVAYRKEGDKSAEFTYATKDGGMVTRTGVQRLVAIYATGKAAFEKWSDSDPDLYAQVTDIHCVGSHLTGGNIVLHTNLAKPSATEDYTFETFAQAAQLDGAAICADGTITAADMAKLSPLAPHTS